MLYKYKISPRNKSLYLSKKTRQTCPNFIAIVATHKYLTKHTQWWRQYIKMHLKKKKFIEGFKTKTYPIGKGLGTNQTYLQLGNVELCKSRVTPWHTLSSTLLCVCAQTHKKTHT